MNAGTGTANSSVRVLIVDDHEVVQWGFRLMLGSQPWVERCIGAHSGPQAVELAARYEPHVAVIDLFVGAESGPDLSTSHRLSTT